MRVYLLTFTIFLSACAGVPLPGTDAQREQRVVQPEVPSPGFRHVDYIYVDKSDNRMYLMKGGKVVRDYHVALGQNPVGHKRERGDNRTPEGRYNLIYKNPKSKFHKSIMMDYPNERDQQIARMRGVDPGDHIVIHGQPNKHFGPHEGVSQAFNWTNGCLAVTNYEMNEIWRLVDIDTPIEIRP